MPTAVASRSLVQYEPLDGAFDEAYTANGSPRPLYRPLFELLDGIDWESARRRTRAYLDTDCVAFRTKTGLRSFAVDPLPRLLSASEWSRIVTGVAQRVRALNEFLLDAYGEQRIVRDGVLPEHVIETAEFFEPDLVGYRPPHGVYAHVAGLDLVRDGGGGFQVLEDNLRSPSGISFAQAAREAGDAVLDFAAAYPKAAIDMDPELLAAALRAAAPEHVDEPKIALVSDGPTSPAWYEHRTLADLIGINLVTMHQLERRGSEVGARTAGRFKRLDVIYRRTDLERLRTRDGKLTRWGELLIEPLRVGTVACVNAFGTGVADDKLTHAYLDRIIDFYLGERPTLRSVPTHDPCGGGSLATVLANLRHLVIKPRGGLGGGGVMIGPQADLHDLETMRSRIRNSPRRWIAQETVSLSTHPTVVRGVLEPRRVDLRPYAVTIGDRVQMLTGSLTRVALSRGGMIVNSSSNGGAKDTWVVR